MAVGYESNPDTDVENIYSYDANGNMTCRRENDVTYKQEYNAENRLSGVAEYSGACGSLGSPLQQAWAFTYDGDGRGLCTPEHSERGNKVMQVHTQGTESTTTYYYAGGTYEVEKSSGATDIERQYYSIGGMNVGVKVNGTMSYFITDQLGSIVAVTNSSGELTAQTRYLPANCAPPERFLRVGEGEVRADYGMSGITAYGYTFQQVVADSGLMDYKARAYDPFLQKFIQPDTVVAEPGSSQGYNRYVYVNNDPVNLADPSGNMAWEGEGGSEKAEEIAYDEQRLEYLKCRAGNTIYCSTYDPAIIYVSEKEQQLVSWFEKKEVRLESGFIVELEKPKYRSFLANKYTPLVFSAISVVATDTQYVALEIAPLSAKAPIVAVSYLVARFSGIVSTVATGYQYKNQLYGTTQEDMNISLATTAISAIPKPDMGFVNHIGFLYTFLRTFGVIKSQ